MGLDLPLLWAIKPSTRAVQSRANFPKFDRGATIGLHGYLWQNAGDTSYWGTLIIISIYFYLKIKHHEGKVQSHAKKWTRNLIIIVTE